MSETVNTNESVVETETMPQSKLSTVNESSVGTQDAFAVSANASASAGESVFGVPMKRRRTSKIDPQLAEAKDVALRAIEEIADSAAIGPVHHMRGEEERLTTHLFECTMPGYRGWFWFATLSRAPRSKVATVCEVGLLPGDDALLAPAWVPWAERMKDISEAEKAELDGDFEGEEDEIEDVEEGVEEDPNEESIITEEIEDLVESKEID